MRRPFLGVLLLLSLITSPALAVDINVTVTTDGVDATNGTGACADATGACTLRAAIQTANALGGADQVILGEGVYRLTIKRDVELPDDQTGDLDVSSEITVVGVGNALPCKDGVGCTAIDGKKAKDRVFDVAQGVGQLALSDLIVRNGKAAKDDFNTSQSDQVSGGCIRNEWGLNVDRIVVENCKSPDDGGCIGFAEAGTNGLLQDTFLNRCKAKDAGGAIEVDTGSLLLNRVTIAKSKAGDQGGGIESTAGQMDLRNVTFSRNKARQGGGIAVESDASATVINATFFDNKAGEGASIFADPDSQFFGFFNLSNSLLRTPKENNCIGPVDSQGGNVENGTDCEFVQASDCSDCFPAIISDLEDNGGAVPTHGLESVSDAIDQGVNTSCETTDARGAARVGVCDSGAFEFNGVP